MIVVYEVICSIISIVILAMAFVVQPKLGRCPEGLILNEGIRQTGDYTCSSPPPPGCGEPIPGFGQCPDPKIWIRGKIYCTNGTQPIVVDYKIVGCQRR